MKLLVSYPLIAVVASFFAASLSSIADNGKPSVSPELSIQDEENTKRAEKNFDEPEKPENISVIQDEDGRADAEEVTSDLIDRCSDFVREALEENQRIGKKDGLVNPGFKVEIRGLVNPFGVMSTMADPGETLELVIEGGSGVFEAKSTSGTLIPGTDNRSWKWTVSENPSISCATVTDVGSGKTMLIHAMVKQPYNGQERIGSFRIGNYERKPLNGNERYKFPTGFIKVTEENADTWITPHLQLKQFLCKQTQTFPSYALIETRLLLKLETLISELEKGGINLNSLYLTSAFRTPHYNRALGNKTSYSRHLYGDAADIFVDRNEDYRLDDLNKDGKVNDEDAKYLGQLVDKVSRSLPDYFQGGLGFYGFNSDRTAFIHTDTRGYDARWGFE